MTIKQLLYGEEARTKIRHDDGMTTATVLAHAMMQEGLKYLAGVALLRARQALRTLEAPNLDRESSLAEAAVPPAGAEMFRVHSERRLHQA